MFGLPQGSEIIILIIVAMLIFGGSRLAGLGKGAGRAIREFKEETRALKNEVPVPKADADDSASGKLDDTDRPGESK